MKNIPDSITKRVLWRYVNSKLKKTIHTYHIFSVIAVLFNEMINDLKSGKQINIVNFGKLSLNVLPPRKYFNVNEKKVKLSNSHKILRLKLNSIFANELKKHLDIDNTFKITK